ncbi:MAG: hypothetical protein ABIR27_02745 [Dokdonella sp.]
MKFLIPALLAIASLSGCVNIQTMALQKGQGAVNTATKSVVLMTIDVSRADESRYQPVPTIVWVTDLNWGAKESSLRFQLNRKTGTTETNGQLEYLASLALSPGRYHFEGISGIAAAFPFVGNFFIPVVSDFEVKPNSVSYLGHLKAVMRTRREGEFRAGSVIPLIDQAASGMINHSWDIVIDDQSTADLVNFRKHVPALETVDVNVDPMPSWDRAAAQRRWDGQSEPEPKLDAPKEVESRAD